MNEEELGDMLRLNRACARSLLQLLRRPGHFMTPQEDQDEIERQHVELAASCASDYFSETLDSLFQGPYGLSCGHRPGAGHLSCLYKFSECEMLMAMNVSRLAFVGDSFMRQIVLAAQGLLNLTPNNRSAEAATEGNLQYCSGAVHVFYLPGTSWNLLSADPFFKQVKHGDLIVSNVAPGNKLSECMWTAHGVLRSLTGERYHEFIELPRNCRAWFEARRYGSLTHLHEVQYQHAAHMVRASSIEPPRSTNSSTVGGARLCLGSEYAHGR